MKQILFFFLQVAYNAQQLQQSSVAAALGYHSQQTAAMLTPQALYYPQATQQPVLIPPQEYTLTVCPNSLQLNIHIKDNIPFYKIFFFSFSTIYPFWSILETNSVSEGSLIGSFIKIL